MKATLKNTLEILLDTMDVNKINLTEIISGGSTAEFIPDDELIAPTGDEFIIRNIEKRVFELGVDNVFNKDVLTLLQTPVADITGILVLAYTVEEGKLMVPLRFDAAIQLATMGAAVSMGSLSNLSLMNLLTSKIEKLVISNIVVPATPADTVANLIVLIFSKNPNE